MRVTGLLCLLAVALVCEAKPLDQIFTNCTKPTDEGAIYSVSINPPAPKKGDEVTVEASFMLKENVTSGKVQVSATLDNVPLYSGSFDLCDIVGYVGLSCPISAGMHSVKAGPIQIPDIAPSGTYSGHATITDQNGKEVGCGSAMYKLA